MIIKDGNKYYSIWEQVKRLTDWKNSNGKVTTATIRIANSVAELSSFYNELKDGDILIAADNIVSSSLGVDLIGGSLYLVKVNNSVKSFQYEGNIKGEQGIQGIQGIQGEQGERGQDGLTGGEGIVYRISIDFNFSSDAYGGFVALTFDACIDSIYDKIINNTATIFDYFGLIRGNSNILPDNNIVYRNYDVSDLGNEACDITLATGYIRDYSTNKIYDLRYFVYYYEDSLLEIKLHGYLDDGSYRRFLIDNSFNIENFAVTIRNIISQSTFS